MLVHRANGVDEVNAVTDMGCCVVCCLNALFSEAAEIRHIILVCDGVDMDEVGGVETGRWIGVLAECEVIEVVDQSRKNVWVVGGEVESDGVCLLRNQVG